LLRALAQHRKLLVELFASDFELGLARKKTVVHSLARAFHVLVRRLARRFQLLPCLLQTLARSYARLLELIAHYLALPASRLAQLFELSPDLLALVLDRLCRMLLGLGRVFSRLFAVILDFLRRVRLRRRLGHSQSGDGR
jgi:hypothetical protein